MVLSSQNRKKKPGRLETSKSNQVSMHQEEKICFNEKGDKKNNQFK